MPNLLYKVCLNTISGLIYTFNTVNGAQRLFGKVVKQSKGTPFLLEMKKRTGTK